jgi:Family of unknown function (DUF6578)
VAVWPVFVEHWQHECCGAPFAIGQTVEWTLVVDDPAGGLIPEDLLVDFGAAVAGEFAEDGTEPALHVVTDDGLNAAWHGARPESGRLLVRGSLREEHHGGVPEGLPATRGTVQRIRLVSQSYEERSERNWYPTGEITALRDLVEVPDMFRKDLERTGISETGVLVDLEVAPRAR